MKNLLDIKRFLNLSIFQELQYLADTDITKIFFLIHNVKKC